MAPRRKDKNDSDNEIDEFRVENQIYNVLFTSSRGSYNFYNILSLVAIAGEIPSKTLATEAYILFQLFSWAAKRYVLEEDANQEDDDSPPVYLLACVGAFLTAGILAPLNTPWDISESTPTVFELVVSVLFVAYAVDFLKRLAAERNKNKVNTDGNNNEVETLSLPNATETERKLMNKWDNEFRKHFKTNEDIDHKQKKNKK